MANYYRIGSAGLNWSNIGSWSSTSGGASNGSAEPSSSDATIFDSNSPATVTVSAAAVCATLNLNKASLVITLNGGSISISGELRSTANLATINKTASETVTVTSDLVANGGFAGTAKIIMTGGTWSGSNANGIANDLDLNGNITFASVNPPKYNSGTLKYVSGTITQTSSQLVIRGNCTLDLDGMTINELSVTAASTITLTSDLLATTLNILVNTVFTGSFGFNCTDLYTTTAAITITLQDSITYTVTGKFYSYTSRVGSNVLITSSHASNKAILTVSYGAEIRLNCSFTRIDASGGRPLRTFNGTVTDCEYINSFYDLKTSAA